MNYKGRQYIWYMDDKEVHIPEEGGFVQHEARRFLHIIDSKKQLIMHYRCPQEGDPYALLHLERGELPHPMQKNQIHVPRWKHDTKRYLTADFVRRLLQWLLDPDTK